MKYLESFGTFDLSVFNSNLKEATIELCDKYGFELDIYNDSEFKARGVIRAQFINETLIISEEFLNTLNRFIKKLLALHIDVTYFRAEVDGDWDSEAEEFNIRMHKNLINAYSELQKECMSKHINSFIIEYFIMK